MSFHHSAHGRFDLWIKNQVLILKAKEQWNEEAALAFEQAWLELATPISAAPWAHLVFLDEWELNTPDVVPVVHHIVAWSASHNMTHVAQVYSPNMLKKYEIDKMVDHSELPFEKQVFIAEADAIHWLNDAGFSLPKDWQQGD